MHCPTDKKLRELFRGWDEKKSTNPQKYVVWDLVVALQYMAILANLDPEFYSAMYEEQKTKSKALLE